MDQIGKLLAIEAIKTLKARYFRCIDTKDWPGLEALLGTDCVLDIRQDVADGVFAGAVNIAAMVRTSLAEVTTVHHGHCPEIAITSETTATGVWAMEDLLRFPAHSAAPLKSLQGFGHYHETYECIGGQWCFKTITLTRLRVDMRSRN